MALKLISNLFFICSLLLLLNSSTKASTTTVLLNSSTTASTTTVLLNSSTTASTTTDLSSSSTTASTTTVPPPTTPTDPTTTTAGAVTTTSIDEELVSIEMLNSSSSVNETCIDLVEEVNNQANDTLLIGMTINMEHQTTFAAFAKALPGVDFDDVKFGRIELNQEQLERFLKELLKPRQVCGVGGVCVNTITGRCITAYYKDDKMGCTGDNELCCMHPNIANAQCNDHGPNYFCEDVTRCKEDWGGTVLGATGLCGGPRTRKCCKIPPGNVILIPRIFFFEMTITERITSITICHKWWKVTIIKKRLKIVVRVNWNHPAARAKFQACLPGVNFDAFRAGQIQLTPEQILRLLKCLLR